MIAPAAYGGRVIRYLLDANICIRMARNADCRVAHRVRRQAPGSVAVSAIALAEIARLETLDALLESVTVAPFDSAAARAFPAAARARGKFDRLIAAHALSLDATLITCNTRDFRDVPGLRIEDWTI
ncbi:MAG TPA: type II toxin-antitoxin system VapC family toxin [Sphingomonas sp.]|nr:type II toxin-antitoxin system VapC family toxin [Sphingomonas sp.]